MANLSRFVTFKCVFQATVEIKDNKLIENHVDNADPTLNIHIEREVTDSDELIVVHSW